MFVSLLDKYIIGCHSCDNIPDIECSLAPVVNIMSFFGSKIITTGFFTIKSKVVKLVTIVEGDQKVPFSIATTLRCRGGHYSFPWIAPLCP